jgi:hypothetical protein
MSSKSKIKVNIKKIDAIIVVILMIIAGLVLIKAGYIYPFQEDIFEPEQDEEEIKPAPPPPPIPPESITMGYMRAVSPEDEGVHFDKIKISREWWYFSAVFNENSDLNGWVVSISFNHMARGDLIGTSKPDLLVITLHGPNGEEYGGMINKERGFGIIKQPTLKANSPGVNIRFEDSWAEGESPEWHVHVEDNEIDDHEIIIDLNYFAPYEPIWTMGDKAFEKSNSNLASYIFTGCNVNGKVIIDGQEYLVNGTGHHEHSWSPNIVTRGLINGWDWSHITLENGWNIYYVNYYPTPQFVSSLTSKINPYGSLIITTNKGNTITILDNINPEIIKSNDEIFPFVRMPIEININAKAGLSQPLLSTYNIEFDIDIISENTYDKIWKFPTYVGMSVGRSTIIGTIEWTDDEGNHELELNGIGTQWSMRALL